MSCDDYDLQELKKVLGKKDAVWFYEGATIAGKAPMSEWLRLAKVTEKIEKAGLKEKPRKSKYEAPKVMVISDDLGTKGILNHANGKMYDSKSAYYQAVSDSGCEIVGNEKVSKKSIPDATSESELKQDIANAIKEVSK